MWNIIAHKQFEEIGWFIEKLGKHLESCKRTGHSSKRDQTFLKLVEEDEEDGLQAHGKMNSKLFLCEEKKVWEAMTPWQSLRRK